MFVPKVERRITFPTLHEGESLSDFVPKIEMVYTFPTMYDGRIDKRTRDVLTKLEHYKSAIVTTIKIPPAPDDDFADFLEDIIETNRQYVPDDQIEKYESTTKPVLEKSRKMELTLGDILSVLNLLVAIFFGLIASMPDKQTERIIAQNEIIIEQQNEIIRLHKEDEALLNTLDSLSNSINLLTNEIELLREELESSDNPSDSSSQADAEDTQQQDDDTQD